MTIKWVDELPEKATSIRRKSSKYDAFGEGLKTQPARWAQWPVDNLKITSMRSLSSGINTQGRYIPAVFKTGKWEARVRQGTLFVRFLGEQ